MSFGHRSVPLSAILLMLGACGEKSRPCEETFTCGRGAGAAGSAGAAGTGQGGAGGSSGASGGARTGGRGGGAGAGAVVGGEGGEAGDGDTGSGGKGGGGGASGKGGGGKGGGSGGTSGASGDTPPEVVSVSPLAGAEAEPDGSITLRFSEPLDASTVTTATVVLRDDGAEIESTVDLDGDEVTLTPVERLSLLTEYTISVDSSVSDLDGTPMAADFSSTVGVRDGVWSQPSALADNGTIETSVAVDGRGNTLVGWRSDTGKYARWHRAGSGWEQPFTLEACATCSSDQVRVAVNDAGDAVAVYDTEAGRAARVYRAGAWGAEAPMAAGNFVAVAMAPTGEAHVISDPSGDPVTVHTNPNDDWVASGYSWSSTDDPSIFPLSLAFDATGNGFAVWDHGNLGVRFSRYNRGQGTWGAPSTITGSTMGEAPVVAVSPSGAALAVWLDGGSGQTDVMASTFSNMSGWSAPAPIDGLDTAADGLAVTWAGTSFVVAWRQGNGADTTNVYSNRLAGAVWEGPTLRSDGISSATVNYPVALSGDAHGNLLLVWRTDTGVWDVVTVARYRTATNDWTMPAPLASNRTTLYGYPAESLAVGANGVAAVGFTGGDDMGTPTGAEVTFFE